MKRMDEKFSLTEHGVFVTRTECISEDRVEGWGQMVSFETPDGQRGEVFVPAADIHLHPYKLVAQLIDQGMRIDASRSLAFVEYLSLCDER